MKRPCTTSDTPAIESNEQAVINFLTERHAEVCKYIYPNVAPRAIVEAARAWSTAGVFHPEINPSPRLCVRAAYGYYAMDVYRLAHETLAVLIGPAAADIVAAISTDLRLRRLEADLDRRIRLAEAPVEAQLLKMAYVEAVLDHTDDTGGFPAERRSVGQNWIIQQAEDLVALDRFRDTTARRQLLVRLRALMTSLGETKQGFPGIGAGEMLALE